MAFRRGERHFDAPDDTSSNNDDGSNQVDNPKVEKPSSNVDQEEPSIHLLLSDFGSQSLARFIRDRLAKTEENAKSSEEKATNDEVSSARTRRMTTRHNHQDVSSGISSSPTTTSVSPQAGVTTAHLDFEEHTRSARSRIRSLAEQSSHLGSTTSDPDEVSGESAPCRRKSTKSPSHLVPESSTSSGVAATTNSPVAKVSGNSRSGTTDNEDEIPTTGLQGSLTSPLDDSDDANPDLAMVDEMASAVISSLQDNLDIELLGSPVKQYSVLSNSLHYRSKMAKSWSSVDYSRHIPPVAPQFVKSKRTTHKPKPRKAPKTAQEQYLRRLEESLSSLDPSTASALKAANEMQAVCGLDMTFDSSRSSWTPRHPGLETLAYSHRPPVREDGKCTTLTAFNHDIWCNVSEYLSAADLKRLRLVNHELADHVAPLLMRSVVTKFGKSLFHLGDWDGESTVPDSQSVLAKHGKHMQKFGISFDYDLQGLAYPNAKVFSEKVHAWFGDYEWPVTTYPRFAQLQELEDLIDCNPLLLTDALSSLTNISELALSLDSGHGWLEGADMCDLALFEFKRTRGTKVFGESFSEDVWDTYSRNEYFKWAQQNSINATLQRMAPKTETPHIRQRIKELSRMSIRDYDSFREQHSQCDWNPGSHTGARALEVQTALLQLPNPSDDMSQQAQAPQDATTSRSRYGRPPQSVPIPPQWPLIFNCYNIAADVGGRELVGKTAQPAMCPLLPGHLTELQAQWLMETLWAQRAFLSSYTSAIIANRSAFRNVHTLTIAKLSSGLLPSLTQHEFWASLKSLKRLKILVKADWRDEHVYGDKFHGLNMPIDPSLAVGKFAEFLSQNITGLENLSHLTLGYFGGGENANGIFARNCHVLPAPITSVPESWVSNHDKLPDPSTLLTFPHIRDLGFENCWFSPCMLAAFMERSRDTSLHTLVLDSVSLLSNHCTASIDGPLSTVRNELECKFAEEDWFRETLPASAAWTDVLNKITPGESMQDLKFRASNTKLESDPASRNKNDFRGNVTSIVLKSCGYCRISGVTGDQLNQSDLVVQPATGIGPPHRVNGFNVHHGGGTTCDIGLHARSGTFDKVDLRLLNNPNQPSEACNICCYHHPRAPAPALSPTANPPLLGRQPARRGRRAIPTPSSGVCEGSVMMATSSPDGVEYFGLGTLTQCVHPIEKRVLEQAWWLQFGWGDDMRRWESVSDGWLEGGTGRFSGTISAKETGENNEGE